MEASRVPIPNHQDLNERTFDDLLRRAADFFKSHPSSTGQERTQTRESPRIKERGSDA